MIEHQELVSLDMDIVMSAKDLMMQCHENLQTMPELAKMYRHIARNRLSEHEMIQNQVNRMPDKMTDIENRTITQYLRETRILMDMNPT